MKKKLGVGRTHKSDEQLECLQLFFFFVFVFQEMFKKIPK